MRAVTLDRTLAAFPARGRDVAAPPPLLQPRDWSRLTTLPRSCAAGRLRKQTAPFLFRRSVGKSAACLPSTFQQANLVLSPPETIDDRRGKSFPRQQRVEFCRSAVTNRSIRLRDRQSFARCPGPFFKISGQQ